MELPQSAPGRQRSSIGLEDISMGTLSKSTTCEIITIGSELLLGQITDTNTSYLARELGSIGVRARFRTAVGDRLDEIIQVIQGALQRCDMLLCTGGLGPTSDDLTREAVARVAGVGLEFRPELMEQIEDYFRRLGYRMPENNRRQAYVPAGSRPIPNPVGTAPGFITEVRGKPIVCLPGVPMELEYLWEQELSKWIRERFQLAGQKVTYRVLKVVGVGESKVDRIIADLMGEGKNPEVGLLASLGEIKIRITAAAGDEREARALIRPVEKEIRSRLGKKIFGADGDTLEGIVDSLLVSRGLILAIIETFSGGLAAQRFHRLPSSRIIESRVIPEKRRLMELLPAGRTALDLEAAACISQSIRETAGADVGLSIIGFPEKRQDGYRVDGLAVATAEGIQERFSWRMGGRLSALQERGAVIGLNTLRLALL